MYCMDDSETLSDCSLANEQLYFLMSETTAMAVSTSSVSSKQKCMWCHLGYCIRDEGNSIICQLLLSNQSFYRQIAGCRMYVGDHRMGQ